MYLIGYHWEGLGKLAQPALVKAPAVRFPDPEPKPGDAIPVLSVRLAVTSSGAASIEELFVDGVAYPEWARTQPEHKR